MKTITTAKKLCKQLQKYLIQKTMENGQNEILEDQFNNFVSNCIIIATHK